MNPKQKHNILKKALTVVGALTLSLTALTTTTLAVTLADFGKGATGIFSSDVTHVYGYQEKGCAGTAWMVDVYVSTAEDGTIDTSKESITKHVGGIERIGGIFFNYNIPDATIMYSKSNTALRNSFTYSDVEPAYRSSLCKTAFNLPLTTATTNIDDPFIKDRKSLSLSSSSGGIEFYVVQSEPCGLPTTALSGISYSEIKSIIESEQFTIDIVMALQDAMGSTNLALSTLNAVSADIQQQITDIALKDKPASLPNEAKKAAMVKACEENLYPDCDNPMVEWAVAVTPLAVYQANKNRANAFWITKDNGDGNIEVLCSTETQTLSYIMDAPTAVMYNEITKHLFGSQKYIDKLTRPTYSGGYGIPKEYITQGLGGDNSGVKITEWGQLRKEYGRLFFNLTGIAHIDPSKYPTHLLGIKSAQDNELFTSGWGDILPPGAKDWVTLASKGGITIALSEKGEEETLPVYYYIYDDNNEPTGEVIPDSYTPNDTGFVPKQDYGIPIADESVSNTDKPMVSTKGEQMYFYYKDYPTLAANVIDYKGTSAESEWVNPKAITTPIKTVSGAGTKAKSIHVKVIQPPSVNVVYHVYNYIVPDEDYDSIKGLTGSDLEEAVKDLTPTVSSSNKSIVLSETNKSYKASTDTTAKSYGTPIHVTATLAGKEAALADAHCPDNCEPGERNWITSASSPKVYKPNGSAVFRADPTTVVNFNDEATGTGTRQIHVKIINVKQAPPLGESAKDRIKTYDVTQLIEDTQQTVSIKPTFSEHRFPNEFPNENTPEIVKISGAFCVFVKRTFFERHDNLLLHSYDFLSTPRKITLLDMLRIGRSKAYQLLRSGHIKALHDGRVWLIPKKSVIEYVIGRCG